MHFDFARECAVDLGDFARFAGHAVAEHGGTHAVGFEEFRCGLQRLLRRRDHAVLGPGEYLVAGLGRFG